MYDQNFKNQAVKECVNGQSLRGTARKYGISDSALRAWIKEYRTRISIMQSKTVEESVEVDTEEADNTVDSSVVKLRSITVNIDGHNITISKEDMSKLMEVFYQFDK